MSYSVTEFPQLNSFSVINSDVPIISAWYRLTQLFDLCLYLNKTNTFNSTSHQLCIPLLKTRTLIIASEKFVSVLHIKYIFNVSFSTCFAQLLTSSTYGGSPVYYTRLPVCPRSCYRVLRLLERNWKLFR